MGLAWTLEGRPRAVRGGCSWWTGVVEWGQLSGEDPRDRRRSSRAWVGPVRGVRHCSRRHCSRRHCGRWHGWGAVRRGAVRRCGGARGGGRTCFGLGCRSSVARWVRWRSEVRRAPGFRRTQARLGRAGRCRTGRGEVRSGGGVGASVGARSWPMGCSIRRPIDAESTKIRRFVRSAAANAGLCKRCCFSCGPTPFPLSPHRCPPAIGLWRTPPANRGRLPPSPGPFFPARRCPASASP